MRCYRHDCDRDAEYEIVWDRVYLSRQREIICFYHGQISSRWGKMRRL